MEREEGEREGRERGRYPQHRPTLLHCSGSRNGEGGSGEREGDTCSTSRHSCTEVTVEMEEVGRGEREREIPAAQADTLALQ